VNGPESQVFSKLAGSTTVISEVQDDSAMGQPSVLTNHVPQSGRIVCTVHIQVKQIFERGGVM
jgi:hypothetical protein